ncbi:Hypothetical Protein FCC1311_106492 [Hondaea fermentalgiana]|uniref:Uncharacterized protein n=1 Tax=Hondaea fermentalgiana TaxID=2315210 RepID=A0A2R5GV31_9STRA|nr:Hypothetical Protein FCC1311_106492 [Hondaea fermentalgiana]|eukprot:GBG34425.1 Hypothetical Protein FCC1311_106492 [Hondaea fermentalgiana]
MASRVEELQARVEELKKEGREKDAKIQELVKQALKSGTKDEELAAIMGDLDLGVDADALSADAAKAGAADGEVSTELLIWFFRDAVEALKSTEFKTSLEEKLTDLPLATPDVDEEVTKERYARVRDAIDKLYMDIWEKYGVDQAKASNAVMNAGFRLSGDDLDEDEKTVLAKHIEDFTRVEDDVEGTLMLGREAWVMRKLREAKFERVQEEIMKKLTTLSGEEAQKFAVGLQQEGLKLQQKLQAMDPKEASAYLENPSEEDAESMMRFQAFQMLMEKISGGGHGHSHGGQPCHGHGHEESHSHGGGHGHSHDGGHGHSHGGKPCHGHGH